MKNNEQFSVAVHILLYLAHFKNEYSPSCDIAESVNTNAVVIRRILGHLQKAGLVEIKRGSAGAKLKVSASDITLFNVYNAVGMQNPLALHDAVNTKCVIGATINEYLTRVKQEMDQSIRQTLNKTTIAQLLNKLGK